MSFLSPQAVWLFKHKSHVPEELYAIPFGKGLIRRKGKDITIVGVSYMVIEALRAAEELQKDGYDVEVIDPRTLIPLDEQIILDSVKKTGHLVIVDTDWKRCGAASEIASMVAQKGLSYLKAPIKIIAWPDIPVPSSNILEEAFYPSKDNIIRAAKEVLNK